MFKPLQIKMLNQVHILVVIALWQLLLVDSGRCQILKENYQNVTNIRSFVHTYRASDKYKPLNKTRKYKGRQAELIENYPMLVKSKGVS